MSNVLVTLVVMLLAGPATAPSENQNKSIALNAEGWKLYQAGRAVEAEQKFTSAVELDPANAAAWNGLGWTRFNQQKTPEAEEAFKKCVELDPKNAGAAFNGLGWIYFQQRDYKRAEANWLDSRAPAGWAGLGQLYLLQGKWDDAVKYLEKSIAANENGNPGFYKELLAAAKNKSLSDELRAQLEPKEPGPGDANVAKGWQLFQQGNYDEALTEFQAALEQDPKNLAAENGVGWCMINTGNVAGAKSHFQIILDEKPKDGAALNGMAVCLKNEGKIDEAIELWKKMTDLYPGPNAGTYGLAYAYYEQDKFEEAMPLLEKLAASNPENQQIAEMLERAKEATGGKK